MAQAHQRPAFPVAVLKAEEERVRELDCGLILLFSIANSAI